MTTPEPAKSAEPPNPSTPAQGASSRKKLRFVCDRCGYAMVEQKCKITCPNCGARMDCSDLTLHFD